jgi:putative two-component system response regulator
MQNDLEIPIAHPFPATDCSGALAVAAEFAHDILVVEDDPNIARLLAHYVSTEGHHVTHAADGAEALARIAARTPDLILLDLEMPRVDGYEVCRRVKTDPATRLVPIIVITGESDAKLRLWELGADEFLAKPIARVEVVARCRSLLRIKRLVDERDSAEAVVFALARAVEAKSPYTHGHSERTKDYTLALAAQRGASADELESLRKGALLHDIGKISVPDAVLNKRGPLDAEEFEIVQQHTTQGARILEPLQSLRDVVAMVRWHHERLDGRGYPDGLRGSEIPEPVRILAVADVYDSLASDRPYRPAIPHPQCLEMLRADAAGGGLDPELVAAFCKLCAAGALPAAVPAARDWALPGSRVLAAGRAPAVQPAGIPRSR